MKKTYLFFTFFITLFLININTTYAEEKNLVNIYIFHREDCPHCQSELKLLNNLEQKYDNIMIYKYEINSDNNKELYSKVLDEYNISKTGVPLTIIGNKYFIGYNEEKTKITFIKTIEYYSNNGYVDKVANIVGNNNLPTYKIKGNQITVEEFIKNYGNYKLLFLSTDNISLENTNVLSTILTELNVYNLLIIIILSLIITKIKKIKEKLIPLIIYITIYLLQNIFYWLNINIINIIILLILLNYLAYSTLLYIVKNNKMHLVYSITGILSIISHYLKINYYPEYLNILKEVININYLTTFEYIIQIIINTGTLLFVTITLIYIINIILKVAIERKNHYDTNERYSKGKISKSD